MFASNTITATIADAVVTVAFASSVSFAFVYGSPVSSELQAIVRQHRGISPEVFGLSPQQLEVTVIAPNGTTDMVGIVTTLEGEPLPLESALRTLPNVVLGAHNGSNTREGVARASKVAVDALLEELAK